MNQDIIFGREYESGIAADVDWVAGGNFDGYVYRSTMIFFKEGNKVILKKTILDQSKYDGEAKHSVLEGQFAFTDHATITCFFNETKMRGKILGQSGEFLAFSVFHSKLTFNMSVCYEWKEH